MLCLLRSNQLIGSCNEYSFLGVIPLVDSTRGAVILNQNVPGIFSIFIFLVIICMKIEQLEVGMVPMRCSNIPSVFT